ncbi:MAG: response regulator [Bacteroidetes bacterium]|nr:MAG: response regulator [Bacteroidota bacterium]
MHILITDDLYTNRLQAGIVIGSLGHTFDEAVNGDEAIEKLSKASYDLILMDIEMPVRNGLETTRFIRTNFRGEKKKTPIIAITAHNPEDFFDNYADKGFSGLISKPITEEKLRKVLTSVYK